MWKCSGSAAISGKVQGFAQFALAKNKNKCYIMRLEDSAKSNNRSKKMNAIIQSGGKQLKVKAGDIVEVEKLSVENGAEVSFDVLAVEADDGKLTVGAPLVDGAKVTGKVLEVIKAKKVVAFKMKRRKGYRRTHGHRQQYSRVEITAVNA